MKKLLVLSSEFVVILLLFFLLPTTNYQLTTVNADVNLKDVYAFGKFDSVGHAVGFIIYPIFAIAGITVVFYFLIGAFKYIISKGDKNLVDAARNQMTHAIIGFIILAIVFFIMQYLAEIPKIGIPKII